MASFALLFSLLLWVTPFSGSSSGSSFSKSYLIDDACAVIRDTMKALIATRMCSNLLLLFWVWFSLEKRAISTPCLNGVPPCWCSHHSSWSASAPRWTDSSELLIVGESSVPVSWMACSTLSTMACVMWSLTCGGLVVKVV